MSKEMLEEYLKVGLFKEYDLARELRDKHDIEAQSRNGVRIKASRDEIAQYWTEELTHKDKVETPIDSEVPNIWIHRRMLQ